MEPVVSVIVTTYNQAEYIGEALQSVFSQTYKHYEVIVVDDGSTDDTPARVAAFGDRVIYVRQRNQGIAASRNTGIRQARGKLVAFLDGDDLWEPEKLSIQVSAAQHHPRSGLIVVDGFEFSDTGILETSLLGHSLKDSLGPPEKSVITGHFYSQLLHGNFSISTTSQVVVPSKVLKAVGLSDPRFKLASDYDLYLRIAARYDATIIKQRLTRWRYTPTSASGPRPLRNLLWSQDIIAVWKKHLREASQEYQPVIRRLIQTLLRRSAEAAYYYGREVDRTWASRYLLRLFARNLTSTSISLFLAGLWCPQRFTSVLGPAVRKMLESKPSHL